MTRIRRGSWQSWPAEVRQALRRLTKRGDLGLLYCVHKAEEGTDHKTFVLFENGGIAAWAMACYDYVFDEYDIMLYVRSDKRRKGYGSQVFKAAKTWVKRKGAKHSFFDDPTNRSFFKKVDPEMFNV